MNQRKQKAKVMMQTVGNFAQVDTNKFEIKSQTNPNKLYNVSRTGQGLVCVCVKITQFEEQIANIYN
ncbi:MAG: hypothetical protein R1F52_06910 [Candidatus Nitrosoabyssus spongiisocia]|nr:MAG: hypothetical protein R1F52_06910 [Nitrosopumilaceae archaeon AB1(1)]